MVSIIIPYYNSEATLGACLWSICTQNYQDLQIILVDDGSTDSSHKVVEEWINMDSRIVKLWQENKGPGAARNLGITAVKGKYVLFVDADDMLVPGAVKHLVETEECHRVDLVIGDAEYVCPSSWGMRRHVGSGTSQYYDKDDILDYIYMYLSKPAANMLFRYVWGKLYLTSILKKYNIRFDESIHIFEDTKFNYTYLSHIDCVFYTSMKVYSYFIGDRPTKTWEFYKKNPLSHKGLFEILRTYLSRRDPILAEPINRWINHGFVYLTISSMVQMCYFFNKGKLKGAFEIIVHDPDIRRALKDYVPKSQNSKLIPLLMKLKLVHFLLWVCKYRAKKRYGK